MIQTERDDVFPTSSEEVESSTESLYGEDNNDSIVRLVNGRRRVNVKIQGTILKQQQSRSSLKKKA